MAVKGSKVKPMRVIAHNPLAKMMRWLVLIVVFATCIPVAYFVGAYFTREQCRSLEVGTGAQQERAAATLAQQLIQLRTNAEVDRQSMEELRQVVMTQKAQLNASERDLRVYKDLLSPGVKTNPLGISFGVFTVQPLSEPGHFKYSLTVQKLSTKETEFSGSLEFRVIGQQMGKPLQLSLYQISAQVAAPSIPLSFKYFHTLEGDMTLPVNFVPQSVELVVKTLDKKMPPLVTAELDWPSSAVKP